MELSLSNLNYVIFENEDARLLIENVLKTTDATLLYFDNVEVSTKSAVRIWKNAHHCSTYKVSIYDRNAVSKLCS